MMKHWTSYFIYYMKKKVCENLSSTSSHFSLTHFVYRNICKLYTLLQNKRMGRAPPPPPPPHTHTHTHTITFEAVGQIKKKLINFFLIWPTASKVIGRGRSPHAASFYSAKVCKLCRKTITHLPTVLVSQLTS